MAEKPRGPTTRDPAAFAKRLWAWLTAPGSALGTLRRAVNSLSIILRHTDACLEELNKMHEGPSVVDLGTGKDSQGFNHPEKE
jgi:hypothetical protein